MIKNTQHATKSVYRLVPLQDFEKELDDKFDELIINKLKQISDNRKKYKPRTRFLILDLFDLRDNKWKN